MDDRIKLRLKFSKHGAVKYIGHLDILRYFQKSMRRAGVDIAYSAGYSPHQIMSFAQPLGVGMESEGEYLDMEVNSCDSAKALINQINEVMVPGMRIEGCVRLPEGTKNAMASVAAASYRVTLKNGENFPEKILEKADAFFAQENIIITKETKKNTLEVDLKPHIYSQEFTDKEFNCFVDASSAGNIKSTQILEALYKYAGVEYKTLAFQVTRIETYANKGSEEKPEFVPLLDMGEAF